MATEYVIITDGVVVAVFAEPQNPSDKPGYAEIPDTDARWLAYQTAKSNAAAAKAAIAAFNAALAGGVVIQSTSKPSILNGTYAIDVNQQQTISGIATGIAARNRVPGGGPTFNYPDLGGTPHAFAAQDFLNFASAIEDYVYALSNGQSPAQPVVIA